MRALTVKVQIEGEESETLLSVPADVLVETMLVRVGRALGVDAMGVTDGTVKLPLADLFADYWEPDRVFTLNLKSQFDRCSILWKDQGVIEGFGISLKDAKMVMFAEGPFTMKEFWRKVWQAAPTLLLVETTTGFRCGGLAAVPWPREQSAVDDLKASFLFSLGAKPRRFDLTSDARALWTCATPSDQRFQFGFPYSLRIDADGKCMAQAAGGYRPDPVQLLGAKNEAVAYRRWELWRL
jgi:hypothetical protein